MNNNCFIFRSLQEKDFEKFHCWMNDAEFLSFVIYTNNPDKNISNVTSETISRKLFENYQKLHNYAVDIKGHGFIGMVGIKNMDKKNGDIYIFIGEKKLWGKGWGTKITKEFLNYCFENLKLNVIKCSVFGYNIRAIKMYEKLGFRQCGETIQAIWFDNKYWSMIYMELSKNFR